MGSYDCGKPETCAWIRSRFPSGATVLDVGACNGKWRRLLPEYTMDAVEIFKPNADKLSGYRNVYNCDIARFEYDWYDLIIFGDVIEHMNAEKAQQVLEYARTRCTDMIIAVPYLYQQGEIYGNPWEIHIQDDLTPQVFEERYPAYEPLITTPYNYCYYHKRKG